MPHVRRADHCFMLKFEEAEAACRAYEDLGLRVFFAPMLNDDAVLYENYVPVALDAEERNAQGQGGGLGPEGRWRTTSGPSNEAKCQANLALWEECAEKLHDPANGVNIVVGPVSLFSCSEQLLRGATDIRRKYKLNGHIHVLESRAQRLEAARRFKAHDGSAVRFLDSTGFLHVPSTTTSLAHCCWLEEAEMQLIAQRGAAIVHNPATRETGKATFAGTSSRRSLWPLGLMVLCPQMVRT
ncbi:5-methylthioadenosine/S-adenosylhomocysteine deaminase 2 (MTA/SAH deaminase 2) [Durusdinium trenchii]|uniref:5-methylthioadenosine/S-adenosylhomocysteine deaminase 2 (MTA/SAH deaminase 2) n=1 Tax=Durusdinium trenchii TaxID=1381693 RepID=A0ABP0L7T0_9DINO